MKYIFLPLIVSLSFTTLFAQKGLRVGFIGGPQFVIHVNSEELNDEDDNIKFNGIALRAAFGPTIGYHLNEKFGLATQFLFSFQGYKYADSVDIDYFRKLTYMKVPVLFHLNSSSESAFGGYFYIGPQFSFLIGKDLEVNGKSLKDKGGSSYNTYADIHKSFTFGFATGFGIYFNAMEGKIQPHFGLRLDGDVTSAYNDSKAAEIFFTDEMGNRSGTRNISGLIEVGIKYIFLKE